MLTYTIQGDDFQVTDAIREYVSKRFSSFEKFLGKNEPRELSMTIGRETAHDHPDAYIVEVKFRASGHDFFVTTTDNDARKAIDDAKDELWREVTHKKGKTRTLFVRGARKLKSIARGFSRLGRKG